MKEDAIVINEISKKEIFDMPCFEIKTHEDGITWINDILHDSSDKNGVYIHYKDGEILYIGKTTTDYMSFAMRLGREFSKTGSQNNKLYQQLEKSGTVNTVLFDSEAISSTFFAKSPAGFSDTDKALILEQVLIAQFKPTFNNNK